MKKDKISKMPDYHLEQLKQLSDLIKEYRRSNGLSRKEFARQSNLNAMTVYRIESGCYDCKLSTILRILDAHCLLLNEVIS